MPNDTVRANAQAMPALDRRAALGALAAGAAVFTAPRLAKAAEPDATLLALARRAAAIAAELAAAEADLAVAEARMNRPAVPDALRVTAYDKHWLHLPSAEIGAQFNPGEVAEVMRTRSAYLTFGRSRVHPNRAAAVERAEEIERLALAFGDAEEAARRAAGVFDAELAVDQCEAALARARRAVAMTHARTVAGVLAKLDVAALGLPALDTDQIGEFCDPEIVAASAALDLAALKTREA